MNSSFLSKPQLTHWQFPDDTASQATYVELLEEVQKHFIDIQRKAFSIPGWNLLVSRIYLAFRIDRWGLFRVFLDGRAYQASTASTCLNVALVASIYTQSEKWSEEDAQKLVRAALCHDVGMLFLPPEILRKTGRLDERERTLMENHPAVSFETVKSWGESFEATQVALQHHEEWNGQGYPGHIGGDKIHPWSRIAGVIIQFVARVTQRQYRNSLVGYEALKLLIKDQGTRFDPVAVRGLVRALGLNPPGSILLLSDGSLGRVIDAGEGNLLKPRVRILIDAFGTVFQDDRGALIDLQSTPKLFLVRPVNLDDITNVNGQPSQG